MFRTSIIFALIMTILFSLLLIYYPVPIQDKMNARIDSTVTIKQNEQDRWAEIPGSLGYNLIRKLHVFLYANGQT